MDKKTYLEIMDYLQHMYVEIPWGPESTLEEMQGWMLGFAACQKNVFRLLESYEPIELAFERMEGTVND